MSRRRSKEKRKQAIRVRKMRDQAAEIVAKFESEGMTIGLTRERAIEIANDAANAILALAQEQGQVRREAWGLSVNPFMLTETIAGGLKLLQNVEALMRGESVPDDLLGFIREMRENEQEAQFFAMVSGTLTIVGAALVLLETSPFPPELMKLVRAVPLTGYADADGGLKQ